MGIPLHLGSEPALTYGIGDAELTLPGSSKLFRHPDQVRQGFCVHLFHDVGAMKFDRCLGGGEFARDLFIKEAFRNERHYLPLAWRELLITSAHFPDFRLPLER